MGMASKICLNIIRPILFVAILGVDHSLCCVQYEAFENNEKSTENADGESDGLWAPISRGTHGDEATSYNYALVRWYKGNAHFLFVPQQRFPRLCPYSPCQGSFVTFVPSERLLFLHGAFMSFN